MKKLIRKFGVLIIVFVLLMSINYPASALSDTGWSTGIKLQNLSSSTEGTISIQLYTPTGTMGPLITTTSGGAALTVLPLKSVEVYLPSYGSVSAGQYSATISSSVPLAAVATMTNYDNGVADSYTSMEPSTAIFIPYVYHNHNSWNTEIFIQNTTNTAIESGNITLEEPVGGSSSSDGLGNQSVSFTIPAYGTYHFDALDYSSLGWFIGAAKITADQPVVATSNQIRMVAAGDTPGNVLIQGRGLTSLDFGGKVVMPSLYKGWTSNGTWNSGIKLQNPGATSIDLTVTIKADADSPSYPFTGIKSVTIPAAGNAELYLPTVTLNGDVSVPDMFKGSAVIEVTTPGGQVIASAQHVNYAAAGYGVALGYSGFATGVDQISLPSLYRWPSGAGIWISGIKVQNLGTNPVTVRIDLTADPDIAAWTGTKSGIILEPGQAAELYLGVNGNLDIGASVPVPWKGSATVTATGTGDIQVVATVLHTNYGRHVANMYTGIPVP